jgi:uncharacterized membrane protein
VLAWRPMQWAKRTMHRPVTVFAWSNCKSASPRCAGTGALAAWLFALFFATIGAATGGAAAFSSGGAVLAFIALQLAVHTLVTFAGASALGIPLPVAVVASNAAVGGPGTAAAMATAQGWKGLVPIAVFLGSLGYAVGTGMGLAVFQLIRP